MATTKTNQQPAAAPEKKPVDPMDIITTDEHAGQGGSFVLDPATGARMKVVAED
jgi:hypothetical protein